MYTLKLKISKHILMSYRKRQERDVSFPAYKKRELNLTQEYRIRSSIHPSIFHSLSMSNDPRRPIFPETLLLGDLKAFPGQQGCVIPAACSGSAPGSAPSWTYLEQGGVHEESWQDAHTTSHGSFWAENNNKILEMRFVFCSVFNKRKVINICCNPIPLIGCLKPEVIRN